MPPLMWVLAASMLGQSFRNIVVQVLRIILLTIVHHLPALAFSGGLCALFYKLWDNQTAGLLLVSALVVPLAVLTYGHVWTRIDGHTLISYIRKLWVAQAQQHIRNTAVTAYEIRIRVQDRLAAVPSLLTRVQEAEAACRAA